jgi:hypothetical protein
MKLHLNEKICETARWMVDLVQDRFRWLPFVLGVSTFVYCNQSVKSRILSKLYRKSCNFCPFVSPIKHVLYRLYNCSFAVLRGIIPMPTELFESLDVRYIHISIQMRID